MGTRRSLAVGLAVALGAVLAACQIQAEEIVFDVTISGFGKTLYLEKDLRQIKENLTGTLTYNSESGEFSFEATETTGLTLLGDGLMGTNEKGLIIGQANVYADSREAPFFTGMVMWIGKFSSGMQSFSGKLYSSTDAMYSGTAQGLTFATGKIKGLRRAVVVP